MLEWYVWTIIQQRHKRIEAFLSSVSEVKAYLYPTVIREYTTSKGKKTMNVPLYNNYIFIKYVRNNKIHARLESCPWIKDCIGVCSQAEIAEVKKLTKQKYEDIISGPGIQEGRSYKLKGTAFRDMTCTVVKIDGDKLVVSIELFGDDRLIKCDVDDIDVER